MAVLGPKELQSALIQSDVVDAPLNTTQVVTVKTAGYDKMCLQIDYVYDSATQIQVTPLVSLDGVSYGPFWSTNVAVAGSAVEGTNYLYYDVFNVTGDLTIVPTYLCNSYQYMQFEITSTGGSVDDLITVSYILSVGPSM